MTYHIENRTLTAQTTAVIRSSMPAAQLAAWLAGAYQELSRYLAEQGIRAGGPPFARYARRSLSTMAVTKISPSPTRRSPAG